MGDVKPAAAIRTNYTKQEGGEPRSGFIALSEEVVNLSRSSSRTFGTRPFSQESAGCYNETC